MYYDKDRWQLAVRLYETFPDCWDKGRWYIGIPLPWGGSFLIGFFKTKVRLAKFMYIRSGDKNV
jgi:hypothetical protein